MGSISRNKVEARIGRLFDDRVSAHAEPKGVKKHVKALRDAVHLPDPSAKGTREFLKNFGKGI